MVYGSILFILAVSLPSLLVFSFLISAVYRKIVIRNMILFLDLFSILFLVYLITRINLPLRTVIYTNIFLFQVLFFSVFGLNLIFCYFYREEIYKNVIDFFFSLPSTILFTVLFFLIFVNVAFLTVDSVLNNLFYTFLITHLNLFGYILLAYYLTNKLGEKNLFKVRLFGGILFLFSSFAYIFMATLII